MERLGPANAMVAAQIGDALVLGSSRDELLRGLARIGIGARPAATDLAHPNGQRPNGRRHCRGQTRFGLDLWTGPGTNECGGGNECPTVVPSLSCRGSAAAGLMDSSVSRVIFSRWR